MSHSDARSNAKNQKCRRVMSWEEIVSDLDEE
jgi:hypothetical protein